MPLVLFGQKPFWKGIAMHPLQRRGHYLWPNESKTAHRPTLIRVLRERQEIEFVQSNGGKSHAKRQTDRFAPISKYVLFMRANLV